MKIGLLSDTHNYLDPDFSEYFGECDQIWHAGDFGTLSIARSLEKIAPLTGVYGNIDGEDIRKEFPLHNRFICEGVDVWMTHIGGIPGRYCLPIREEIEKNPPDMFICGHSHILKIGRDQSLGKMLFVNPGAAGKHGFHVYRTAVRFEILNGTIQNMEVINMGKVRETV